MSPEEFERAVQFLLQQQAQADARIDRLAVKTEQVADGLIGLTAIVGRVADQFAESQKRTDEQFRATDARLGELAQRVITVETHIETVESHLDVVIQMFERHLREDHGHRPS